MNHWLRRIRGAALMGLTWAIPWAVVGVLVGLIVDPDGSMDEMWPAIGAYPGFLCGVIFSAVLAIAARNRRFEELSVPRFAVWGALAGLLLAAVPFALLGPSSAVPRWLLGTAVIVAFTAMSSASAAASLVLARKAEPRALHPAGETISAYRPAPAARPSRSAARGRT